MTLIGHLGKDPELQYLEGGTPLCKFTLATNEVYKDKNGNRQESTEWHNITTWRVLAENAGKYLHKGSLIYLEGRIKTRSWTDKENNKRYTTEIVADNFTMLDRREGTAPAPAPSDLPASPPSPTLEEDSSDDLPF